MSELKSWADYSTAELLEALERNEPRHRGDLFVLAGVVYRWGMGNEAVCSTEFLRAIAGQLQRKNEQIHLARRALDHYARIAGDAGAAQVDRMMREEANNAP